MIRVGGGYLSYEEFIKQYAPNELVKLNASESLNKSFNTNNRASMTIEDFKKLKIDISAQITPKSFRGSFNFGPNEMTQNVHTKSLNASQNDYDQ